MPRRGDADVALVFRYAHAPLEDDGFRLTHVTDDPIHLVSRHPDDTVADHRNSPWIGGCARCRSELTAVCTRHGFTPRIDSVCDDMVVVQALVAAGIGVTTLPSLALRAHRNPEIHTTEIPGAERRIYTATYGDPPDPPARAALREAIQKSAADPKAQ